MKTLALLCLLVFGTATALTAFAEEEGAFGELSLAVKKKTVEKMAGQGSTVAAAKPIKGNQTGGSCKTAADCTYGCKTGEADATCISVREGNASCASAKEPPPGGLKCTCLTSVYACGFAFP